MYLLFMASITSFMDITHVITCVCFDLLAGNFQGYFVAQAWAHFIISVLLIHIQNLKFQGEHFPGS